MQVSVFLLLDETNVTREIITATNKCIPAAQPYKSCTLVWPDKDNWISLPSRARIYWLASAAYWLGGLFNLRRSSCGVTAIQLLTVAPLGLFSHGFAVRRNLATAPGQGDEFGRCTAGTRNSNYMAQGSTRTWFLLSASLPCVSFRCCGGFSVLPVMQEPRFLVACDVGNLRGFEYSLQSFRIRRRGRWLRV